MMTQDDEFTDCLDCCMSPHFRVLLLFPKGYRRSWWRLAPLEIVFVDLTDSHVLHDVPECKRRRENKMKETIMTLVLNLFIDFRSS